MSFVCLISSFERWFKRNIPEPDKTKIQSHFNMDVESYTLLKNTKGGRAKNYQIEQFFKDFILIESSKCTLI